MYNLHRTVITSVDSYKMAQHRMWPKGTEYVYSYIESRGGTWDEAVFFGLNILLKSSLFAQPLTHADIDFAKPRILAHGLPFNEEGWKYIVDNHGGKLPVEITAVPEGTVVNGKNVLVTIVNTDPNCHWLVGYLETIILRAVWYPVSVATLSRECKKIIKASFDKTSDDLSGIMFKLHDFGARGASSQESAEIGGAAHLVNFMGTDTFESLLLIEEVYGLQTAGYSVPASEHSCTTAWGRDNEIEAYRNALKEYGAPGTIVSLVSDSYNIYNAVDNIFGYQLKEEILKSGATLVVRPDSGDPTTVPVEIMNILDRRFGSVVNSKGFKVLKNVRVLQGDGMNIDSLGTLIKNVENAGFAIDNLVVGMGGKLLTGVNRDTLKFAMKCSAARINGEWVDVYKDPITDHGKLSKMGRLALVKEDGVWATVPLEGNEDRNLLVPVYRNGEHLKDYTFDEIRERAAL